VDQEMILKSSFVAAPAGDTVIRIGWAGGKKKQSSARSCVGAAADLLAHRVFEEPVDEDYVTSGKLFTPAQT
jgi:hypothetical protein